MKKLFELEPRGPIAAKHERTHEMFFLNRLSLSSRAMRKAKSQMKASSPSATSCSRVSPASGRKARRPSHRQDYGRQARSPSFYKFVAGRWQRPLMEWSGRVPAPPANDAEVGRFRDATIDGGEMTLWVNFCLAYL